MYRVQFKNAGGHVFSSKAFDCDDDAGALIVAQTMYVPAFGHGFDLWDDGRLVFSYPKRMAGIGEAVFNTGGRGSQIAAQA